MRGFPLNESVSEHVAERPGDLDGVSLQRHEHREHVNREQVDGGCQRRPLLLAPEHRQRGPADEDEKRDGKQSAQFDRLVLRDQ